MARTRSVVRYDSRLVGLEGVLGFILRRERLGVARFAAAHPVAER